MTTVELIRDGVLSVDCASLLGAFIEQGASVVVAAGPSGAGKTTMLTALLEFLPPERRRFYLRGCFEPFDFLPTADPESSALLINEMSPHLPIYLWGDGVRAALQAANHGYQLLATAHALDEVEFIRSLTGYPLRIPAGDVAALDLLVLLDVWIETGHIRREVRRVANFRAGDASHSISVGVVADRSRRGGSMDINVDVASAVFESLGGHGPGFEETRSGIERSLRERLLRSEPPMSRIDRASRSGSVEPF